jgi:PPOX class probable F420-dependent enzyme
VRCASMRARYSPACVPSLSAAARDLLANARVAHLATADQYARPHAVPIVFVWREGVLYTPLDRKPKREDDWHALRRVRTIDTNGRVAIVVDRYDEDWSRLAWVMLEGIATILETGEERDAAAALLTAKYAQYETLSLEGRPIVRVELERASEWPSDSPSS